MKSLKEALVHKHMDKPNPFGLTEKDLIGGLKGFPMGVVVRMMEEQEKQGNKLNISTFQRDVDVNKEEGGFDWSSTEDGLIFWSSVMDLKKFKKFYERHPEYKKYDI